MGARRGAIRLDRSLLTKLDGKTIVVGCLDLNGATVETPETIAERVKHAPPYARRAGAGLWQEIPAARCRGSQGGGIAEAAKAQEVSQVGRRSKYRRVEAPAT